MLSFSNSQITTEFHRRYVIRITDYNLHFISRITPHTLVVFRIVFAEQKAKTVCIRLCSANELRDTAGGYVKLRNDIDLTTTRGSYCLSSQLMGENTCLMAMWVSCVTAKLTENKFTFGRQQSLLCLYRTLLPIA